MAAMLSTFFLVALAVLTAALVVAGVQVERDARRSRKRVSGLGR